MSGLTLAEVIRHGAGGLARVAARVACASQDATTATGDLLVLQGLRDDGDDAVQEIHVDPFGFKIAPGQDRGEWLRAVLAAFP